MTYFDYAAATPTSPAVASAMAPYYSEKFYNPSALYLSAQSVKQDIGAARADVAKELGCKPSEIIFTAGGTESDNLAINGVMQRFPGKNCLVSAVEHEAVLKPAAQYDHKLIPVLDDGRIDLRKLESLIDNDTVLVSVMYVNNEIGTVQPLAEVARVIKSKVESRKSRGIMLPIYLHSDACQAPNYLPLLVNRLGVDMMTLNGGKIYGPKQSGVLFVNTGVELSPQILGGGQERGLRSGTENPAAIAGFVAALRETSEIRSEEQVRLAEIRDNFIAEITKKIPGAVINGSIKHRIANNVHLTFPGQDNERLMMELDERGMMVATGSACSASSDEPSHVLGAIGLSDEDARSSLRITFGRSTTEDDAAALADALASLVNA